MGNETSHVWDVIQAWLDVLPYPPNQTRLAARLGIKRQSVNAWKTGAAVPTPEHLAKLAEEMQPVAGPEVHERLRQAVLLDRGYEPPAKRRSPTA